MKRALAVLVAVAPLAVAGCSDAGSDAREPLADDEALTLIREDVPYFADTPDEQVAQFSSTLCDAWASADAEGIAQEEVYADVLHSLVEVSAMPAREAGSFNVYAVSWKCPELFDYATLGG